MKSALVPTVFIIDDDRGVSQSIQDLMESVGLRSESFATGQEFLSSKHPDGPCCLVLDVRLPGMSGLDFQRQLAEAGVQIPVIFVTGHGDIPMTVKAMKSGRLRVSDQLSSRHGFRRTKIRNMFYQICYVRGILRSKETNECVSST